MPAPLLQLFMTPGEMPFSVPASRFFLLPLVFVSVFASLGHAESLSAGSQGAGRLQRPGWIFFDRGERVEYRASWNGIPVASADIHAEPVTMDGKRFYEVKVLARTWRYLELIWKMRDSIESVFEAETLHPRRFIFRQRENRRRIDTTAHFDPLSQTWSVRRQQGRKVREYEFVSQETLDPIVAFYLARGLDLRVGDSVRLNVFGGKSRYLLVLNVVGRERVAVRAGDFDAYRIVPQVWNLTRSGYAGRLRQAVVWISADEKRWPLRMVSEVFIGSVDIEMVGVKS